MFNTMGRWMAVIFLIYKLLISIFLNRDSTQYKFAKRYGLLEEKEIEVTFWFEKASLS